MLLKKNLTPSWVNIPSWPTTLKKIAGVLTRVARRTALETRTSLTKNLVAYLTQFYKQIGRTKVSKKVLGTIRDNPAQIYRNSAQAVSNGTIAILQQYLGSNDGDLLVGYPDDTFSGEC